MIQHKSLDDVAKETLQDKNLGFIMTGFEPVTLRSKSDILSVELRSQYDFRLLVNEDLEF
jgi:hypothetical protein